MDPKIGFKLPNYRGVGFFSFLCSRMSRSVHPILMDSSLHNALTSVGDGTKSEREREYF